VASARASTEIQKRGFSRRYEGPQGEEITRTGWFIGGWPVEKRGNFVRRVLSVPGTSRGRTGMPVHEEIPEVEEMRREGVALLSIGRRRRDNG